MSHHQPYYVRPYNVCQIMSYTLCHIVRHDVRSSNICQIIRNISDYYMHVGSSDICQIIRYMSAHQTYVRKARRWHTCICISISTMAAMMVSWAWLMSRVRSSHAWNGMLMCASWTKQSVPNSQIRNVSIRPTKTPSEGIFSIVKQDLFFIKIKMRLWPLTWELDPDHVHQA